MTPQSHPAAAALTTDSVGTFTVLDRLHELATTALSEHRNDNGRCATCHDSAFPCNLAILAEHNAAL